MNRREFVMTPGATLAGSVFGAVEVSWQRRIRRLGQLNMTEHDPDPAGLDVEEWADYWASLKIDAVLVSVTGILAFYQTKVPFHRKGKYLGARDFFGECSAAAKEAGNARDCADEPGPELGGCRRGAPGVVPAGCRRQGGSSFGKSTAVRTCHVVDSYPSHCISRRINPVVISPSSRRVVLGADWWSPLFCPWLSDGQNRF